MSMWSEDHSIHICTSKDLEPYVTDFKPPVYKKKKVRYFTSIMEMGGDPVEIYEEEFDKVKSLEEAIEDVKRRWRKIDKYEIIIDESRPVCNFYRFPTDDKNGDAFYKINITSARNRILKSMGLASIDYISGYRDLVRDISNKKCKVEDFIEKIIKRSRYTPKLLGYEKDMLVKDGSKGYTLYWHSQIHYD